MNYIGRKTGRYFKGKLRPGQRAPATGQYCQFGPRGRKFAEVEAVEGSPLPPTPKKGMFYRLQRRTFQKPKSLDSLADAVRELEVLETGYQRRRAARHLKSII